MFRAIDSSCSASFPPLPRRARCSTNFTEEKNQSMKYQEEVAKETLFVTVQRRGSDVAGLADTRWHGLIVQIEEEGKKEAELREEEEKEENRGF